MKTLLKNVESIQMLLIRKIEWLFFHAYSYHFRDFVCIDMQLGMAIIVITSNS